MINRAVAAALMSVGLLIAAPAFAQTAPPQKQKTQEGAPATSENCNLAANANPAADPACKQRTQSLVPSSNQADPKQK
jgi:hypothetical protein